MASNSKNSQTVTVKLLRSPIGCVQKQRDTVRGLGLGRVGTTRTLQDTPSVRGMVRRVSHLVAIQEN